LHVPRELLEAAALKFRIEQELRRAVDRGEFELLFQPEVNFDALGTNSSKPCCAGACLTDVMSRRRIFWPSPKNPASS
jgi:EAL domain-containing protein (putative c-di-GMP-specific phosphodiesterase class I)